LKITLVRHGEVDEAYHGRYNGHIDIELSPKGESQAKKLAHSFKDAEFDGVFCSDLIRAKETLKPFKQHPFAIYTEKLREKSWGRHEGKSFDEIVHEGEIEYIDFLQWIEALDGEPYELYVKRVREFFFEFIPSQNIENILIITHAGVIRVLMSIVQNLTLEEAFSIKFEYSSYIVFDSKTKEFSEVLSMI